MSVFGSVITIKKENLNDFSNEEKDFCFKEVEEIKTTGKYEDMMGEKLKFSLSDHKNELTYMLSEFWYGDESEEEFEFAKDNEIDQVEEITRIIQVKLGGGYTVKGEFIDW